MQKIRILVVEDSLTVRRRLVEVLNADPELQVAGEAGDGKTAIELCQKLRPDVVTLDMILPVMSGLAATEYIMAYCPTPILIVSSSTNRGELFKTYDALAAGAMDVLEKPNGGEESDAWEQVLAGRVKLLARVKAITHIRARLPHVSTLPAFPVSTPAPKPVLDGYRMVAMGASTGGPAAAKQILETLPRDFPLPILLVIHIGQAFGAALAEWLGSQSQIPVRCAVDGEPLPARGEPLVLMAPPDRHLIVRDGRLRLTLEPERHSCRPSLDSLFESVAEEIGGQSVACLLTGMGRDGAAGLLAIRRAGGRTLVQDELTSTVFGMPAEAIRMGAAERVLGVGEVATELIALAAYNGWRKR
jgi:two-component system, chemotaxis family, protein-glutamate methylesterase/glutaminase